MKRSIGLWQLWGFAVTALGGTLLHFLYDWLGGAVWVAPFSGINESTWEHMKLLFWPMLLFAAVQRVYFRDREDFWCIKLRGTLLGLVLIPVLCVKLRGTLPGLALIPVLFYTYNGAIGKSPDWLNIAIFFVSAAVAYLYETRLWKSHAIRCQWSKLALLALCIVALLFIVFTFLPPRIGLFEDPLTGSFGI